MANIKLKPESVEKLKTDAIVIFLFEDKKNDTHYKTVDTKLGKKITSLLSKKEFTAKKLSVRAIDTLQKLKAETVIVVGLGKDRNFSAEVLRQASAKAIAAAKSRSAKSIGLSIEHLPSKNIGIAELAQAAAEGLILSGYSFTAYKKKKKSDNTKKKAIAIIFSQKKESIKVKKAITTAEKTARGVFLARDLQNHPGNIATPAFVANQARKHLQKAGVKCKVLGKQQILKLNMGSFWAVAKGSAEEPKFLIMEHMKGPKSQKPIVLVGKGLTFDTGGISLKPAGGMEAMKFDMSGGAAVIGTMLSTGLLKTKKNIVGLVPLTENMPGGKANKPGDVIKASDGQTIEVLNTDAEGRLILADALVYAQKYKPAKVIDLATLTGAIMVALGSYATGLFSNDQKLADSVLESGRRTGERCWQFPLWEEYENMIKSKIADMQNIGGRYAGSITAAAFLKKFTDYPWVHLDIAGTADSAKPTTPYNSSGGTGVGVRLLLDFLQKNR